MPWLEITYDEYQRMYAKERNKLAVYSSGIGTRYFPEDYIATTWGFNTIEPLNFIKSLKEYGEWHYWKWEGLMPKEED